MGYGSDIRTRSFTYAEFRAVSGLSKKEADGWVQAGVIQAGAASGHRREYRFESIFEGIVARQLADFSSRELLPRTMAALRDFLMRERVTPARISPDLNKPRLLVKIHARKSKELMAGGGVRGVVSYVEWYKYEAISPWLGPSVYVLVDLTAVVAEAGSAIADLPSGSVFLSIDTPVRGYRGGKVE